MADTEQKRISKFSSKRVERLAVNCIRKIFHRCGLTEPSETDAKIFVNSGNFKTIIRKSLEYSYLRHNTKYGLLDREIQAQLNLKLALYDIIDKPGREKRELIGKVIQEQEEFIKKTRTLGLKEVRLLNFISEFDLRNSKIEKLVRKADLLFAMQKNKLRRLVLDEDRFERAICDLSAIYSKHLKRIFEITNNKCEKIKKCF